MSCTPFGRCLMRSWSPANPVLALAVVFAVVLTSLNKAVEPIRLADVRVRARAGDRAAGRGVCCSRLVWVAAASAAHAQSVVHDSLGHELSGDLPKRLTSNSDVAES